MNTTTLVPSRLLRRVEAAQYIQNKWGYPCSPRTLAKYAVVGGGPPSVRQAVIRSIRRLILMNGYRRNSAHRCVQLRT